MNSSNATIIRQAYADFANGNIPAAIAVFDAAITWHVPGHGPLSGDYHGQHEVVGFFQRTMDFLAASSALRCSISWPKPRWLLRW